MYTKLNPDNALIWRLTHRENLSWILDNGLHCASSSFQAPNYITIGNNEVIDKRKNRPVSSPPGGTLNDYIPFYFTPFSPMMYNIHTGKSVTQYPNTEIIILVSSLRYVAKAGIKFLFTDRHASYTLANYYGSLKDLIKLDWGLWQQRDFQRDPENPEKMDRYQAEALIYRHLPIESLQGIVCFTTELESKIKQQVNDKGLSLKVKANPDWYFK